MNNKELLKTNVLVSVILILGFSITAFFSYRANYQSSVSNIEQVSSLTTEGIYYQLTAIFTKPVNISLTMSHDSLLVEQLSKETEHLEDQEYVDTIKGYLDIYREKYEFDSVFLVSSATRRYYNFNGIDRVLTEDDPENDWYFQLMNSSQEYSMNVDNDEVDGSDNAITVFVNCKIIDQEGRVLGVVGVGIRVSYLKEFLQKYEDAYDINAYLIDDQGIIQISTSYTGYGKTDWFSVTGHKEIRETLLGWRDGTDSLAAWTGNEDGLAGSYVVSRYIPELSWHLVVEQDQGDVVRGIRSQLFQSISIIAAIIITVLLVITTVIRNFTRQITKLTEERQEVFKKATEQLYDNIYELNITRNCPANLLTNQYFESLGARGLPVDQAIRVIAEKQIKEEYRKGYISTFSPENVMREYEQGNSQLRYDFMITQDGVNYFWMRIDAYMFLSQEDDCLHMFTYRRNIDEDKKKEMLAYIDEMTKFLTKTETKRRITYLLLENSKACYALFIFDIDNFKQANDCFGHAFGDYCIKEFCRILRKHFREEDVLGRVGGDEFVAFIPVPDREWVCEKAKELSRALDTSCVSGGIVWKMSSSIGVSLAPADGMDFDSLYVKADKALYHTKQSGKNGFTICPREED